jgi:hypothetical protein
MSERFQVHTCTGQRISAESALGKQSKPGYCGTTYVVLDSAVCYRIVQEFAPRAQPGGNGYGNGHSRKEYAERLCARLNREYP